MKALLLATLTISTPAQVQTNTTVLDDNSLCPSAMMQVVRHHGMQNNIYSKSVEYIKARKRNSAGVEAVLTVTCEEMGKK